MKFISLEPFVPSGPDFERSKQFFQELGFKMVWDAGDYAGLKQMAVNSFYRNTIIKNLQKAL